MKLHTENLTILFVDIVGYTATTSRQSRAENADLLKTFNHTLLPLIQRFDGKLIKNIGDAMLLTFRSPTDAMLCSMAMQDAMHNYNLHSHSPDPIHIRVAANLGEVRVTKNDIFGEPVNLAARIEGVAPADEIYLSEAVYMAMNKAEVPAREAGEFTLAGVAQPVRLYNIPRFATHRLVPQNAQPAEAGGELLFPYGGMHLSEGRASKRQAARFVRWGIWGGGAVACVLAAAITVKQFSSPATPQPQNTTDTNATQISPETAVPAATPSTTTPATTATTPEPTTTAPAPTTTHVENPVSADTKPNAAPPPKPAQPKVAAKPASPSNSNTSTRRYNTVAEAKRAYRARTLDREGYRSAVRPLESAYDQRIRQLKLDYRAGRMTREQYRLRAQSLERTYYGE